VGIYVDHQATSPMSATVRDAYLDALGIVGNPSSIHQAGQRARALLDTSKERIAKVLGCEPIEIVLTSGGTEAINTVLKGAVWSAQERNPPGTPARIVSTRAEHHATIDALSWLAHHENADVVMVPVDTEGVINLAELQGVLARKPADLVSSLVANNEVGSVQPIDQIVAIAREHSVPVHVDAIAALGYLPINFQALGVQAMSVSAHKVGGPVGVGALVLSRLAPEWHALHHGGDQQRGRSGTLDAAGALAFAVALEERERHRLSQNEHLISLRERLKAGILSAAPHAIVRGSQSERLPGNVHITVPGCEGDVLLYLLDERGVHVSTGSACQAGVPEASHVLLAMGVNESDARGALRFSLSYSNTVADVDAICAVFSDVVRLATHAGLAGGR